MINKIINYNYLSFNPKTGKIIITPLPGNKIKQSKLPRDKKNFRVGIIIDTALSIPPTTGVTYRLYYLSQSLARQGYEQIWFIGNRNFPTPESLNGLKNQEIKRKRK